LLEILLDPRIDTSVTTYLSEASLRVRYSANKNAAFRNEKAVKIENTNMGNSVLGYKSSESVYQDSNIVIYYGIKESDQTPVILKCLKAEYPTLEEIAQLRHEYKILQPLKIQGIISAYGLENYRNGLALILEGFYGETLKTFFKKQQLKLSSFLIIAIQLAEVLAQLHQDHIIHKNIQPQNIIICPNTLEAKITDFSSATRLSREIQRISSPHLLKGNLAYMSPEQTGRMNRVIDYRTDFYSLGVTFYEILTGILPFQANDALELVYCHIAKQPVPPHEVNPEIPQVVSAIVMKLLSKTAEERYQSGYGLKVDLEQCLEIVQGTRKIENFIPGHRDSLGQFLIPQKLYGREPEVATLMNAFKRVASGKTEMLLISGYSGIGKSSLVNEVHKPIVSARGYFIAGKFDQFKKDIPYAAFAQAFRELCRQLLTESMENLQKWRSQLLDALEQQGQIIIDVIPEVELIIGKQPDIPKLGLTESQNRFNRVFQQFLQVFTKPEHPLVLFLDDLQWADSASLKLIHLLMGTTDRSLLMIGAYRDNEVSPTHPFIQTLEEISKTVAVIHNIVLQPLNIHHVHQLIADTLQDETQKIQPLVELIFNKTQGNPFFITQLLQTLNLEKLLSFDFNRGSWEWDISHIQALGITDYSVVELISRNLQKLPASTQRVLQIAACIGDTFDLHTLSIVNERSESETAADLWDALQFGLVLPLNESYKIPLVFDKEVLLPLIPIELVKTIKVGYKFLHDRVQQAAYSQIEQQRAKVHLQIGRLLLSHTPQQHVEEKVFEIVSQLNLGSLLLSDRAEKEKVANLNLMAGRKAKFATAYKSAINYLSAGIGYLENDSWTQKYDLIFALSFEKAQCEWLNDHLDEASYLIDQLISYANSNIDLARIYSLKTEIHQTKGEFDLAVETSIKSLKLFGIILNSHPIWEQVVEEYEKIWINLGQREIEDLINLPLMTNLEMQAVVNTLAALYAPAYFTDSSLVCLVPCLIVNLSLQYGNTDSSTVGYAAFGRLLVPKFSKYREGYQFGKLAYDLIDKYSWVVFKSRVCDLFGISTAFWVQNISVGLEYAKLGFQVAVSTGDVGYACYACMHIVLFLFVKGESLDEVYQESEKRLEFVKTARFHEVQEAIVSIQRLIQNLHFGTDDKFAELAFEDSINQYSSFAQSWYFNLKSQSKFLSGDYQQAVTAACIAEQLLEPTQLSYPESIYYSALAIASYYSDAPQKQPEFWEKLQNYQEKLKFWAENCPDNFLSKWALVAAEIARIEQKHQEAMYLYEQAIKSASENKFIQNEAIANELAAKFYLSQGFETIFNTYIQKAYTCYARWGATAKVKKLQEQYSHVFGDLLIKELGNPVKGKVNFLEKMRLQNLDLSSILKASQAISEEIFLEKLLQKFMSILMESTGAKFGLFLQFINNEWKVVVKGELEGENLVLLSSFYVENQFTFPVSIINYVARTKEYLVLDDATQDGLFTNDLYVTENKPKSVLCLPTVYYGRLNGILYLENNLAKGTFTDERLQVLNLLSSQAAISLENANLYQELQTYSQKLEQQNTQLKTEITKRQAAEEALQQSEERLRLAVESTELGTWDFNPITGVVQWSDRTKLLFGLPVEAEVDYSIFLSCLHPEDQEQTDQSVQQALDPNGTGEYKIEYRTLWGDGTVHWIAAQGRAFFNQHQQAYRFIGTVLDISSPKFAEEQLKAALQEKVVLLKEIHHRVKNNLQIISSLLNLQSEYLDDPLTLDLLKSGQNRVASMALLHEQLYQSEDFAKIDFGQYICNLAANLFSSYNVGERIGLKISSDEIYLDIDKAIPCGLIVNELVSNSIKYAFPSNRSGEVNLKIYRENESSIILIVSDNGIGIPQTIDLENPETLGLKLIIALTNQLDANLEINRNIGTKFKVDFQI
jgi:PAS domain S-box-containing protein